MMDRTEIKSPWFLIHTNPKQEERTVRNLEAWNVETFFPQVRERRYNQFTGERYYIIKPLFARYIFARFDVDRLFHKVRYTRGVRELVGFGDGPATVDQQVIDLVQSRIGEDGLVRIGTGLKPGDPVMVMGGVLKDFTGIFEREMEDSERVMVLLNTISYQARLEIDRNLLQKLGNTTFSA